MADIPGIHFTYNVEIVRTGNYSSTLYTFDKNAILSGL